MRRQDQYAFSACLLTSAIVFALIADVRAEVVIARISDSGQRYWAEEIVRGLHFPSSMAWLPNEDMLITEHGGDLRIVRNGKIDSSPVSGTPMSYPGRHLKDILLDPDFKVNQMVYLLISEGTPENHHAAVYRARYSFDGLKDVVRILRANNDMGGYSWVVSRMIFLADKTLLVSIPESHHEGAQQLGSHKGKTLRINRDGSVPPDNPFLNTPGALPEIWSYGHRVPLGLYQEVETGLIWEIESGPRGGDELNLIKAGGNYGWAKASWGFAYGNNGLDAPLQSGPGIQDPVLIWTPSVTPSGLTRYHGEVYPQWDGDYFLGHLTTKALERLRIYDGRVVVQERMLLDLEERIRDIKNGPDGYLYLLTDHQNGRLLRLRAGIPGTNQLARLAQKLEQPLVTMKGEDEIVDLKPGDLLKGRQAFIDRCAVCHSIGADISGGKIGPDLTGVYGSLMGRKPGFNYSPNMADSPTLWDFSTLDMFLADPSQFVRGTQMAAPPVSDIQVRRQIIGFLKQQSSK